MSTFRDLSPGQFVTFTILGEPLRAYFAEQPAPSKIGLAAMSYVDPIVYIRIQDTIVQKQGNSQEEYLVYFNQLLTMIPFKQVEFQPASGKGKFLNGAEMKFTSFYGTYRCVEVPEAAPVPVPTPPIRPLFVRSAPIPPAPVTPAVTVDFQRLTLGPTTPPLRPNFVRTPPTVPLPVPPLIPPLTPTIPVPVVPTYPFTMPTFGPLIGGTPLPRAGPPPPFTPFQPRS